MAVVSHNEHRSMDEGQVVKILSAEQVCQLTGLSARQLGYWDQTGFFSPTFVGPSRGAYNRVYSYRDVVGLRAIAVMRKARGQRETSIEMDAVDRDVREGIVRLRERRADQIGQVSRHRHTAGNKPVVAGTRVPPRRCGRCGRPASTTPRCGVSIRA